MERGVERHCWSRWDMPLAPAPVKPLILDTGPAHAVYFGTYEVVKEFAGGNKDDHHHPFAAGICAS
jgi:hypothetical protein